MWSFCRSQSGRPIRKSLKPRGRVGDVGLEEAVELEQRLVVEGDAGRARRPSMPASLEAVTRRALVGKRKSCFLRVKRSSWAAATISPVLHQAGRAVVVEGRDAEDVHRLLLPTIAEGV